MIGPWQIVIILLIVLILFGGGGKISRLMGDFGRGITALKKGLKEGDNQQSKTDGDGKVIDGQTRSAEDPAADSSAQQAPGKDQTAA